MDMDCQESRALLPWLVNETLDASQERRVAAHLESCDACRAELEETRVMLAVAAQHLPIEALVARAAGRDPGVDPELLETHLASCRDCAGELALLVESREALADAIPAPAGGLLAWRPPAAAPSSAAWWRGVALAASLATLVAGVAAVRSVVQNARLGARLARLEMPVPNVAVVDLLPVDLNLRGEDGEPPAKVPAASAPATLILNSGLPASSGPFRLEIRDDGGRMISEVEDLMTDRDGLLTLSLVTEGLPSGKLVVQLLRPGPPREPLESYLFQVR